MKQRVQIRKVQTSVVIIRCQMFGGRNGQCLHVAKNFPIHQQCGPHNSVKVLHMNIQFHMLFLIFVVGFF